MALEAFIRKSQFALDDRQKQNSSDANTAGSMQRLFQERIASVNQFASHPQHMKPVLSRTCDEKTITEYSDQQRLSAATVSSRPAELHQSILGKFMHHHTSAADTGRAPARDEFPDHHMLLSSARELQQVVAFASPILSTARDDGEDDSSLLFSLSPQRTSRAVPIEHGEALKSGHWTATRLAESKAITAAAPAAPTSSQLPASALGRGPPVYAGGKDFPRPSSSSSSQKAVEQRQPMTFVKQHTPSSRKLANVSPRKRVTIADPIPAERVLMPTPNDAVWCQRVDEEVGRRCEAESMTLIAIETGARRIVYHQAMEFYRLLDLQYQLAAASIFNGKMMSFGSPTSASPSSSKQHQQRHLERLRENLEFEIQALQIAKQEMHLAMEQKLAEAEQFRRQTNENQRRLTQRVRELEQENADLLQRLQSVHHQHASYGDRGSAGDSAFADGAVAPYFFEGTEVNPFVD